MPEQQIIRLGHQPRIESYASIVGQKEGEGPMGGCFDSVQTDPYSRQFRGA